MKDTDANTNQELCLRSDFQRYIKEQERLIEKKNGDQPITKHDSLTRIIMVNGLKYDFEKMQRKV
ncbi:MAG: hypothetical protein Sapg2KO_26610 [Saprospiraceae bacterium]